MFPPEIQLILNAQTAIQAGKQQDPRFGQLVDKLMERLSMSKEQVIHNIIMLMNGRF